MITGAQIIAAREVLEWSQGELAKRAKLPLSVVARAELSPGEPVITIAQRDAIQRALEAVRIVFAVDGTVSKRPRKLPRTAASASY